MNSLINLFWIWMPWLLTVQLQTISDIAVTSTQTHQMELKMLE